MTRKWNKTALITHAYLKDGAKIRLSKIEEGIEKTWGVFDYQKQCEIWALQKGTEVTFNIEGDVKDGELAAVLVTGTCCDNSHSSKAKAKRFFGGSK
jgi:hypothetical protein